MNDDDTDEDQGGQQNKNFSRQILPPGWAEKEKEEPTTKKNGNHAREAQKAVQFLQTYNSARHFLESNKLRFFLVSFVSHGKIIVHSW